MFFPQRMKTRKINSLGRLYFMEEELFILETLNIYIDHVGQYILSFFTRYTTCWLIYLLALVTARSVY